MQRYKIIHRTYYNYSGDVILGPHKLLIRPRADHEMRIESYELKLTPEATLLWHRDVENNSVAIATFETPASQLIIESEVIIQQYNESPLDFVVSDYAVHYPFIYKTDDIVLLSPYMALPNEETIRIVNTWISNFWHTDEAIQTYTLLGRIAQYIHNTLTYRVEKNLVCNQQSSL